MNLNIGRVLTEDMCWDCKEKTETSIKKEFKIHGIITPRDSLRMARKLRVILRILDENACEECRRRIWKQGQKYSGA